MFPVSELMEIRYQFSFRKDTARPLSLSGDKMCFYLIKKGSLKGTKKKLNKKWIKNVRSYHLDNIHNKVKRIKTLCTKHMTEGNIYN